MSRLTAFGRFLYDFVIGDDWRIAAVVAIALGVTALVADSTVAAWWILPVAVLGVLGLSVARGA